MKKKKAKPSAPRTRQIKFRVTAEEQNLIRGAAALSKKHSMAAFAREVVLNDAQRLTVEFRLAAESARRR